MAKQNQHIEEYLDAYREMPNTDFAVMITGPWGCGKTYFIREYLKGKEHLYVSLNGIDDARDINLAVFKSLFPVMDKKAVAVFGKTIKAAALAKFNFNLSEVISLSDFATKVGNRLLVFDDLERCLLSLEKILGEISGFVVENKTKVVLIGEEQHLNDKTDDKYQIIKEKVVGKTFRLTERIDEIFENIVLPEVYPQTHEVIGRNKDRVVSIFQTVNKPAGKHNYRALKHAFRDFEYFYPKIDGCFTANEGFINDLFRVFVILGYEIQLGNMKSSDITPRDLAEEIASNGNSETDTEKPVFQTILERHGLEWSAFYVSSTTILQPEMWAKICSNEGLTVGDLTEAIKNCGYFPCEQPEWVTLWHWGQCNDDVAQKALQEVQKKIDNHDYCSYEIIMHVFSILIGLSEYGAIEETKDEILNEARGYLDDLVDENRLLVPEKESGWNWANSGSHNLGYWTKGGDFESLVSLIDCAIEKATEKNRVDAAGDWLDKLTEDDGEFLSDISTSGQYYRTPVFKYLDPAMFIEAFLKAQGLQKWEIRSTLKKRYEYYSKDLIDDLSFFESVLTEIDRLSESYTGLVNPSHKNLEWLREDVVKVVELLKGSLADEPCKEGC